MHVNNVKLLLTHSYTGITSYSYAFCDQDLQDHCFWKYIEDFIQSSEDQIPQDMTTIAALVLMATGILLNIIVIFVWIKDEKKYRSGLIGLYI